MKNELPDKLNKLRLDIESENYSLDGVTEWGGADVIICNEVDSNNAEWIKNQPIVISPQETDPMRRIVVTEYSLQLSWLFIELREAFYKQIWAPQNTASNFVIGRAPIPINEAKYRALFSPGTLSPTAANASSWHNVLHNRI